MFRIWLATLAVFASITATAPAASWAEGMFDSLNRDFGTVARGPTLTHSYSLTNNTARPVRITGVRVSCGCVSAAATQADVAPGQAAAVVAHMDTRRFTGHKTVTIYVTFDQPAWEEVRLTISAVGRDDIGIDPEVIGMGQVLRGGTGAGRATVTLRHPNWVVLSAAPDSTYIQIAPKELARTQSEAVYELTARLNPGLPVGQWYTDVWLATNHPSAPRIRVPLMVEVLPALSISPGTVTLGSVKTGTPTEKKITVRGGQPFRITSVEGTDAELSAQSTFDDARPVHILTVKFNPKSAGDRDRKLKIVTDLGTDGVAEVAVRANVSQ